MSNTAFQRRTSGRITSICTVQVIEVGDVSAQEETFGPEGTFKREMSGEVVLFARLRKALVKLNPKLPSEPSNQLSMSLRVTDLRWVLWLQIGRFMVCLKKES